MESMTAPTALVTVGVDTHLDLHMAAVLDHTGRLLGTQAFPASTRGYVALVTWARHPRFCLNAASSDLEREVRTITSGS